VRRRAERGLRPRLWLAFAASLVIATLAVPAAAATRRAPSVSESRSKSELREIVVTAQRRKENLQKTPVSATAITDRQLAEFGMRDLADYAQAVANLSFGMGGSPFGEPAYGYSSTREIVIRGVSGANTTSLYIDDTPIPDTVDPRVLDLDRIEVLRGPQGTLFGASSMGGTVRLITKQADPGIASGKVDVQAFDIDAGGAGYDASGSVNLPLPGRSAALRVSAFDTFHPGHFTRIYGVANVPGVEFAPGNQLMGATKVGGTHEYGGSATALISPEWVPGLSINAMMMLQRSDVTGYPLAENEASNFTQVRPLDVPEGSLAQWQLYAMTAKYATRVGDLISSTSYFNRHSQDVEDGTMWFAYFQGYYYSPLPYLAAMVVQTYATREVTQELRFRSRAQAPVQFTAGLFFQRIRTSSPFSYLVPGLNAVSGYTVGTDNIYYDDEDTVSRQAAGFANITYRLNRRWELSAGIRKTWLDSSGHQKIEQPASLDANVAYSFDEKQRPVTPRFVARFSFDSSDMAYASASKGFRIGGENAPATGPCAAGADSLGLPVGAPVPYYSDSLWSYEIGLKDLWNDRKIATRGAVYDIEWSDVQQTVLLPVCGIPVKLNAGAARILGAEWEVTGRTAAGLEVEAAGGYEDGKITSAKVLPTGEVIGSPVGTPLSGVPKWTASLRAGYSKPMSIGDAFIRAEYSFVGSSLSLANGGAGLHRAEYSLVNLRGGLEFGHWSATLFVRNLFNRAANYGDVVTAAGVVPGQSRLVVAQPRTIGLELQRSFGAH